MLIMSFNNFRVVHSKYNKSNFLFFQYFLCFICIEMKIYSNEKLINGPITLTITKFHNFHFLKSCIKS